MTYHKTTPEQIRKELQTRIDEAAAELAALKAVKIDTKQKTLTNRAIKSDGARIGDYIDLGKALYIHYTVTYKDGHNRHMSRDITAYSYQNPDGSEIGSDGWQRISRTITPAELAELVKIITDATAERLAKMKSEYSRAAINAKKRNALVEKINAYNNSISYASESARI